MDCSLVRGGHWERHTMILVMDHDMLRADCMNYIDHEIQRALIARFSLFRIVDICHIHISICD